MYMKGIVTTLKVRLFTGYTIPSLSPPPFFHNQKNECQTVFLQYLQALGENIPVPALVVNRDLN